MRTTLIIIVGLVLAVPSLAQLPPPLPGPEIGQGGTPEMLHPEDDHPRAREAVARFLGLDEGQKVQWDGLIATLRQNVEPIREQQRSVAEALKALLESESPDPAAVGGLVLEEVALRQQVGETYRLYNQSFAELLTPDQVLKFQAVRRADQLQPLLPSFHLLSLLPRR